MNLVSLFTRSFSTGSIAVSNLGLKASFAPNTYLSGISYYERNGKINWRSVHSDSLNDKKHLQYNLSPKHGLFPKYNLNIDMFGGSASYYWAKSREIIENKSLLKLKRVNVDLSTLKKALKDMLNDHESHPEIVSSLEKHIPPGMVTTGGKVEVYTRQIFTNLMSHSKQILCDIEDGQVSFLGFSIWIKELDVAYFVLGEIEDKVKPEQIERLKEALDILEDERQKIIDFFIQDNNGKENIYVLLCNH